MKPHVLIVGGGPTGMTLALQLQRFGIDFRLIEKRQKEPSGSKALSINPASLNLLDDLGVAETLIGLGHKTEVINLVYDNRPLMRARFARLPSKFPFFLMLPQPETERVLEQRLNDLGHAIERDCELLGLRQHDDGVEVELRSGNARQRQHFDYVVGCDGGLSKVRNELGLDFSGYDYNMHFILADLRIQWSGAKEQGFYFIRDDGFLILLPLKDGYHRIVIKVDEQCAPGYKPSLDEIRDYIARYQIAGLQVSDPIWISSAPFYNRSASAIRRGRVFLGGDAAHLFSPIGGFGMNSGIADAFNLGWKLGYSLNGQGNDDNMYGYHGVDALNGGDGNDRLNGGDGNDTLRGGNGNDILTGGNQDDGLWGDAGTDRFNFDDGWGDDTIHDFANNGLEKINLAAVSGIANIGDLTITNAGGGALITFGANTIHVLGLTAGQLDNSDFIF